jgi:hypothetical protein
MGNESAVLAYVVKMAEAVRLLEALKLWTDDMGDVLPDDVDWAHVGDATQVVSDLTDIAQFIGVVPNEA